MIAGLPDPLFLMGRGGGGGAVKSSSLLNNLVSYWNLNEASGTAADSAGTNTLTANNSPVGVPGKIADARQFVSASSQSLTARTTYDNVGSWAFDGWVRIDAADSPNQAVLSIGDNSNWNIELRFIAANLGISWAIRTAGSLVGISVPSSFALGAWSYWYVEFDGGTGNTGISLNAGALTTAAVIPVASVVNTTLGIGTFWNAGTQGRFVHGLVDEVGRWSRVLTPTQRTARYDAGAGITYPFTGVP